MKIEYIIDDSIRDYSATGNRPENSFTPIHPPVHPTPTRRISQTRVTPSTVAIIVDTPENCQESEFRLQMSTDLGVTNGWEDNDTRRHKNVEARLRKCDQIF